MYNVCAAFLRVSILLKEHSVMFFTVSQNVEKSLKRILTKFEHSIGTYCYFEDIQFKINYFPDPLLCFDNNTIENTY